MSLFSLLTDILFIGHSLVGPTLPTVLDATLKQMGDPAVVEAQIINGSSLAYNWDNSANAEGVDAKARLKARPADVLIMTEAQPLKAQLQYNDTAGYVAKFAGLALEANPQTRIFVYETWPSLNSGPGIVSKDDPDAGIAWRERLALELPLWEGVVADASAKAGYEVKLLPVGQAMGHLADEIKAGKVPGVSDIKEMFSDDIHLSGKGLYFVAMVQAAAIMDKSPEGVAAKVTRAWTSRDAVITQEQAGAFQRIAWEALQTYVPGKIAAQINPAAVVVAAASDPISAAAPTPPPAAMDAPFPSFKPVTNTHLALGLAGVNDWSVQQPFLNVMKTARPWIGHLPGQFGGWTEADLAKAGALGPHGWPVKIPPEVEKISTLILTELPADAAGVAGRYRLSYQGKGTLTVEGRVQVVAEQPGEVLFDFTPGDGLVAVTLLALDATDPIRDIVVVRASRAQALADGAIFNPDWLARIRGVKGLRFMDWMMTNDSSLADVKDRPLPADYSYARNGVPAEVMVALANELHADPWFTLPHLASDDLVRIYAQIAHDGLDKGLKAQVEYSNEVWNWQFAQARWAEEQGIARWGQDKTWVQFYGLRAAQVMAIWSDVFKDDPTRLTRIMAVQTGWLGLEEQILDAPLVVAEGLPAPADSFDAYAVTGYFSAELGGEQKYTTVKDWLKQSAEAARNDAAAQSLTGADADAFVAAHRYDLADKLAGQELRDGSVTGNPGNSVTQMLAETLPYHATIAANRGLKLMMYEGGSHVVGYGSAVDDEELTAFFVHLNFTPEMGALYAEMLAGWQLISDQPFNAFVDVFRPLKWGSWGALRHLGDNNPRWDALAQGCITC
ncbi:hypothetical protein GCM10010873_08490 [Cypionkella aquatica]|uniref:Uncharacterized protein n=1 Tax=Cypionkella aquatica TaxID=1756042 RepID=A0AA37TTX7_9RHOB|nr:hypothetical protein [Cypionkella aquatica]GLS85875.1 hypothetical protein GCM10010873_08490 [Cypionkella aquatica]